MTRSVESPQSALQEKVLTNKILQGLPSVPRSEHIQAQTDHKIEGQVYNVDNGASLHMMRERYVSSQERKPYDRPKTTFETQTANDIVRSTKKKAVVWQPSSRPVILRNSRQTNQEVAQEGKPMFICRRTSHTLRSSSAHHAAKCAPGREAPNKMKNRRRGHPS